MIKKWRSAIFADRRSFALLNFPDAVFEKVKERYYWPQMFDDVRNYVRTCDVCQRRGPPERKEPLVPLAVKEPFYQIGIDVKGPLPRTVMAIDISSWPWTILQNGQKREQSKI